MGPLAARTAHRSVVFLASNWHSTIAGICGLDFDYGQALLRLFVMPQRQQGEVICPESLSAHF